MHVLGKGPHCAAHVKEGRKERSTHAITPNAQKKTAKQHHVLFVCRVCGPATCTPTHPPMLAPKWGFLLHSCICILEETKCGLFGEKWGTRNFVSCTGWQPMVGFLLTVAGNSKLAFGLAAWLSFCLGTTCVMM
eukprot:1140650-Pelagomonas_calceolata.AAC.1